MERTTVLIIGGGATGAGILRDLSMRGIDALLVEQQDLAYGTSSRYHGLLHSGGRYAVKDPEAARECIEENRILRKIGVHCVEAGEGFFIRTPEDDEAFEETWLRACGAAGIPAERISVGEALRKEPNLSPKIESVYRVPDAAVDGFRLIWQNVASARRYGGRIMTYTEVIGVAQSGGQVAGATVRNTLTGETKQISCDYIVSAAGSWAGKIAGLAGIAVKVRPDRGTLVAFNHRICGRVINRLRPPSDGDIFVPHGSITILGTTSASTENPDDTVPTAEEVVRLLEIGSASFEQIHQYRILRAFAGTRPLYSASGDAKGRGVSRGFVAIDHASDGLAHFISVVGGKFTTYRLMAEKVSDTVCTALGAGEVCRTAEESIVEDIDPETLTRVRKIFPVYGAAPAASRLGGAGLKRVLNRIEERPETGQLLCECETVTVAEAEVAAADVSSHTLSDVRRKTRMGMGTCQGAFCAYRCAGSMLEAKLGRELGGSRALLKEFIAGRWKGIRPVLWGNVLREAELTRSIYGVTLNIDGAMGYEKV